jgi:hypothetical protein
MPSAAIAFDPVCGWGFLRDGNVIAAARCGKAGDGADPPKRPVLMPSVSKHALRRSSFDKIRKT